MSTDAAEPVFDNELEQRPRGLRSPAILSATVHALLWFGVLAGMAVVVPRLAQTFADFGVEVSSLLSLLFGVSVLAARYWPLWMVAIAIGAFADWMILENLRTGVSHASARLWFWANVALPVLVGIGVALYVGAAMMKLMQDLS